MQTCMLAATNRVSRITDITRSTMDAADYRTSGPPLAASKAQKPVRSQPSRCYIEQVSSDNPTLASSTSCPWD